MTVLPPKVNMTLSYGKRLRESSYKFFFVKFDLQRAREMDIDSGVFTSNFICQLFGRIDTIVPTSSKRGWPKGSFEEIDSRLQIV